MCIPRIGMLALVTLLAIHAPLLAKTITVEECLIMLIDEAQVAAQESGILTEVSVKDGQQVEKDAPLAKVDEDLAILQRNVAIAELNVVKKESENLISVKYAQATADVAGREVKRIEEANRRQPNTFSESDYDKAILAWTEAKTYIEKALFDLEIKKEEVKVKTASLDAAEEHIKRRIVRAPWDGVVDRVVRHQGDWVEPGTPVLRLIRMDKLRVKCVLDRLDHDIAKVYNQPVRITVQLSRDPNAPKKTFDGTVIGVSPIVQAGDRYLVWAEVANDRDESGYWILRDGMTASMEIETKQ